MAHTIAFFGKFLAQIEIQQTDGQIMNLYFAFPFSSSFLQDQTLKKVIAEATKDLDNSTPQERLLSMAIYLNEEVQFRYKVS